MNADNRTGENTKVNIQLLEEDVFKNGLAVCANMHGCSPEEIREVEGKFGVTLPAFYRCFLQKMGRRAGEFLVGSDVFYPQLLNLREYAEDLLRETRCSFSLGKEDFVFFVHQGYQFAYFRASDGDDPPVWYFYETWKEPQEKWSSLSAFFCEEADKEGKLHGQIHASQANTKRKKTGS
jgi:hypothetical protein